MLQSQQSQSNLDFILHWAIPSFVWKDKVFCGSISTLPWIIQKAVLSAEPGGNFISTHHILFELHIQLGV